MPEPSCWRQRVSQKLVTCPMSESMTCPALMQMSDLRLEGRLACFLLGAAAMSKQMQIRQTRMSGHITVIQERRFLLATDEGQGCQLTLAHDATVDIDVLRRYQDRHTHVDVMYSGDPGVQSGVAHTVEPH